MKRKAKSTASNALAMNSPRPQYGSARANPHSAVPKPASIWRTWISPTASSAPSGTTA